MYVPDFKSGFGRIGLNTFKHVIVSGVSVKQRRKLLAVFEFYTHYNPPKVVMTFTKVVMALPKVIMALPEVIMALFQVGDIMPEVIVALPEVFQAFPYIINLGGDSFKQR
jgi:hypothetical protein